jgi:hypothetical protein
MFILVTNIIRYLFIYSKNTVIWVGKSAGEYTYITPNKG